MKGSVVLLLAASVRATAPLDDAIKTIKAATKDGRLPHGSPIDRHWQRGRRSGSIARHLQHLFMWRFVDTYGDALGTTARCLDWDGWYVGSVFDTVCAEKDVIVYTPPAERGLQSGTMMLPAEWSARPNTSATRWYKADAMTMSEHLPHGKYDLIIANSVFEHLRNPFKAMAEVTTLLKPGGYLFWHTPFQFQYHGVPYDYMRYTHLGAAAVAEEAGLTVEFAERDGGYRAVVGNDLGYNTKYWTDEELLEVRNGFYLSTRMVARKPVPATSAHSRASVEDPVLQP